MCSQLTFPQINPRAVLQQFSSSSNIVTIPPFISSPSNVFDVSNLPSISPTTFSKNTTATRTSTANLTRNTTIEMPDCCSAKQNCRSQSNYVEETPLYDVFLGGSCGNTVWRQDLVIPYLKKRSITYYDPQRPVWSENLIHEEAVAKENSKLFLFVLDPGNINATSFLEIAYLAARNAPKLVVVFLGRREWSDKAHPMDLPDRIRTCNLLEAILKRHSVPMLTSINEALDCVDEMIIGEQSWSFALSNPLQRIPFIQLKSAQFLCASSRAYKRFCNRLRSHFTIYLRRAGVILFIEAAFAMLLITFVFHSTPVWAIITPFILLDYVLIIVMVIYCKLKVRQQREKVGGKLIINGTPIPRMTESASLIKSAKCLKDFMPSKLNGVYVPHIWKQVPLQMPYSTSLPSDISSKNINFVVDEVIESPKKQKFGQKVKRRVSGKTGKRTETASSKTEAIKESLENCQCCNNDVENESEKENNTNSNDSTQKTALFSNSTSFKTSSLGHQLENSTSLVDSKIRNGMHRFNGYLSQPCSCTLTRKEHYLRRQRRETIATSTATDAPGSIDGLPVSRPEQVNCPNCIKGKENMTFPVGYDVFLSCSSSNELDWITQKAVPQLYKSNLTYTSALMCDKEMRIPMLHTASHILYYIPSYKTFLSGMIEIAYFIGHWDWQVTVCVPSKAEYLNLLDEEGKTRKHDPKTIRAVESRNECYRMAFCYLKDMARRRQCRVFTKVEDAIKHIASDKNCYGSKRKRCGGARLRQIVEKQHLVNSNLIDVNNTSHLDSFASESA